MLFKKDKTQEQETGELEIPPTEDIIDVASIEGDCLLTTTGELVIMLRLPAIEISTVEKEAHFNVGISQVIHNMQPQTSIQMFQMPLPTDIGSLTDSIGERAFHWGMLGYTSEQAGDGQAKKHYDRREIAMQVGASILDYSGQTVKRETLFILKRNAKKMGRLTDESIVQAYDELYLDVQHTLTSMSNAGIPAQVLSPREMLEVLWFSNNINDSLGLTKAKLEDQFLEMCDTGEVDSQQRTAVMQSEVDQMRVQPEKIKSTLAPINLEEHDNFLVMGNKRIMLYYIEDFLKELPSMHRILGDKRQFADKVIMSTYFHAPSSAEIADRARKTASTLKAVSHMNDRVQRMQSYKQEEAYMAVEAARYGAETEKNVIRLMGMYIAFITEDNEAYMRKERTEFEAVMRGLGLKFLSTKWVAMDVWRTMQPLAQRYHMPPDGDDRNIFSENVATMRLATSQTRIEPGGEYLGVGFLSHGMPAPIAIRRARGGDYLPSDARIGRTGSGKSFAMKFDIYKYAMNGDRVVVIDPKNEFDEVIDRLHGDQLNVLDQRGFNIFTFDRLPVDPASEKGEDLSELMFDDNLYMLYALYTALKGHNQVVSEREGPLLMKALIGAMNRVGMDPKDPRTWAPNKIFLKDIYDELANELRAQDPEQVQIMLTILEAYASRQGHYYDKFNTPTNFRIDNDITGITFGTAALSQGSPVNSFAVTYAMRMVAMKAIYAYLMDEELVPFRIFIDEASHILTTGDLVGQVVKFLTKLGSYGISVHLAFQDMNAIEIADKLPKSMSASNNTLAGSIPTYFLFKQEMASAITAARYLSLSDGEIHAITKQRPGECILVFTGESQHIPMYIAIPQVFFADFDTKEDAQKARTNKRYAKAEEERVPDENDNQPTYTRDSLPQMANLTSREE